MKLYNTLSRSLEEFVPVNEGQVNMYNCGPTVYNYIHVGNARPLVIFDTLRRYFIYKGYDVNFVVNFTDIDDKIINRANEEHVDFTEISERYIEEFKKDANGLHLYDYKTINPRATEMIPQMIEFIKTLESKDAAYVLDGDVYFDITKAKDYGKLSKKNIDELMAGARIGVVEGKRNPGDFVLWKKKKEGEEYKPLVDIRNLPAPHKIKAKLDEYVVGQEYAKKVMSVAVYNHYKRVATDSMDDIEIEKSNMLMIGPTGSGKTYLVKTLARILDVPLAITDATSLTEAGYIGDDIESVVSKLLAAADNDVEKAEQGIIFIDEIDKIAKKKNSSQRDVSGESVQQGMLKLLEGSEIEVPVGATSKNAMVPQVTVNTKDILFICGGAFPDLEDIIKTRLNKSSSMGFNADLKDKYDDEKNIMSYVTVDDLREYGMIPEFLGRLPIIYSLDRLDEDMLVNILKEPKNAILKQYQKLLALDEVKLEFDDGALHAIAKKAMKKDTGARALRAIIEEFMLDIMYEIPKDDNIGEVVITKEYIEGTGGPVIMLRGQEVPRLQ